MSDKDPMALVEQIQASIKEVSANNEKAMASIKEASEKSGADAKAAIKLAEEAVDGVNKASASIVEIEQKMADNVRAGKAAPETLAQIVMKSEGYKQFAAGNSQKFRIQANTITGQEGSPPANSDTIVPADRLNMIVPGAFRRLNVLDVLPQGTTTSNSVEYTKELAFTSNAAETAEGATKPEASLTFTLVNSPVVTIATWLKASKQVLEDSSMLETYIDRRLRHAINQRYESQIIAGDGTGQNLSGILDSGNHTAFTPTTGENQLDSINRMIQNVITADYVPTAVMLNPADWHAIERLKVGASDDRYIIGDPASGIGPRLWGLPVVVSNNVTSGTAIVGDFTLAYQIFNRTDTVVEMFEQDETNVQQNLLTIRAERRGAFATFVPAAVQAGSLTQ